MRQQAQPTPPLQTAIRLQPREQEKLAKLFTTHLSKYPEAVVYLFGSRVDPQQKGGDLDLLIVSQQIARHAYQFSQQLRLAIKETLGDQKVDIVITPNAQSTDQPAFVRLALLEGVQLWP